MKKDKKYNLLIPMAGRGQRFVDQGYIMPKPLIIVNNKQMIEYSMDSVDYSECNITFVVRQDHVYNYSVDQILKNKYGEDINIIALDKITRGTVESCLMAQEFIDNDLPLIINTLDIQFSPKFDPASIPGDLDGLILTFKANSTNYSYVQTGDDGLAKKTAEKTVISPNAAVGIYCFKSGKMFCEAAREMIESNYMTNNEFYVSPMYNLLINKGKRIGTQEVEKMYVTGTPKELEFYLKHIAPKFGRKPIGICCDHSGFKAKELAKSELEFYDIPYIDYGTHIGKDCDYADYVYQATHAIKNGDIDHAIGFCRSGQGVNIAANKCNGIISALIFDEYTAKHAVKHNCANFFAIPEKYVDQKMMHKIINILLTERFDGGRHQNRIDKVIKHENSQH